MNYLETGSTARQLKNLTKSYADVIAACASLDTYTYAKAMKKYDKLYSKASIRANSIGINALKGLLAYLASTIKGD